MNKKFPLFRLIRFRLNDCMFVYEFYQNIFLSNFKHFKIKKNFDIAATI